MFSLLLVHNSPGLTFMSWSVISLSFQHPEQEEDKAIWTLSQNVTDYHSEIQVHTSKNSYSYIPTKILILKGLISWHIQN